MELTPGEGILETADGAQLFYRVVGQGPPAVYIHPFQNPTLRVAEIVPYQRRLTFVLLYPRGMTRSSPARTPEELGLDRFVDDIEELRHHLGVDRWVVHGRSEGGFVALQYAARYPQAVSSLLLFATAASYHYLTRQEGLFQPDHPGFTYLQSTLWRFLADPSDANYAAHWAARARILIRARIEAQGREAPPALLSWEEEPGTGPARRTEEVAQGAALRFRQFMLDILHYDVRPALPGLDVPALMLVGRYDPYCTVDQSEELAALLPRGELIVFEHAAHALSLDEPKAVEAAVLEFLTRHGF